MSGISIENEIQQLIDADYSIDDVASSLSTKVQSNKIDAILAIDILRQVANSKIRKSTLKPVG